MLCLLIPALLQAQEATLNFTLKLRHIQGKSMANVKVFLRETQTDKSLVRETDKNGKVNFTIAEGRVWSVSYLDMKDFMTIERPDRGSRIMNKTHTYYPPDMRKNQVAADRNGVEFEEKKQYVTTRTEATQDKALIYIKLVDRNRAPQSGIVVYLTNVEDAIKYVSKSGPNGKAVFLVPINRKYEIDVDGVEAHSFIDVENSPYMELEKSVLYVPTSLNQTVLRDTVTQDLGNNPQASSRYALSIVQVKNFDDELLANEKVYWDVEGSETVYQAITDQSGKAYFLLPKDEVFTLHLTYEREIRRFDNTKPSGLVNVNVSVRYRGTDFINNYFQTAKRNKEGFIIEFMETPVEKGVISNEFYSEDGDDFVLDFKQEHAVYTPLIHGGKLYTSKGFYSNEFFCFNQNGQMVWSVKLGENGASPASCEDGILLINTESCTLYALDMKTGELLWSKWLSSYLVSSPSVADGKVYVAYQNDISELLEQGDGQAFVAACFDLKTGDIIWQKWLNHDCISAPVISGTQVFYSTLSGALYRFNGSSGEVMNKYDLGICTAPTIYEGDVYYSRRKYKPVLKEELCKMSLADGEVKVLAENFSNIPDTFNRIADLRLLLSYDGARPVVHKGYLYQVVGKYLCCYNLKGKEQWKTAIASDYKDGEWAAASMPVFNISHELIVTTVEGKVLKINQNSGIKSEKLTIASPMNAQPLFSFGYLIAPTLDGKIYFHQTWNRGFNGWEAWGGDGKHNPVFD